MKTITKHLLAGVVAITATTSFAAEGNKPKIQKYSFDDNGYVQALSDNGKWALEAYGTNELAEAGIPKIINVTTGETIEFQSAAEVAQYGKQPANDITNDGEIVVGAFKNDPAYWKKSTREWVKLPYPPTCTGAQVTAVTPDGKYAIGRGLNSSNAYFCKALMWDLTTNTLVDTPNLPVLDMSNEDQKQQQFISISNDGRYILGSLSYSYLQPVAPCVFVYDRETSTAKFIGFDPNDTSSWTPWVSDIAFIDEGRISANGKYVVAHAWTVPSSGDSKWAEGDAVVFYNVETGEFSLLPGSGGMLPTAVDNSGTVYAASPAGSPIREWSIYYQGYWYPMSNILSQKFDMDFYKATNYGNTGTVMDVTGDGLTMTVMVDPAGESYSMTTPVQLSTLCSEINLLDNYSVSPASGMTFSKLRSVEITFDREVEFIGNDVKAATLTKSDGTLVRNSSGIAVSSKGSKIIVVTFRTQTLESGESYTVTIPEGIISIAGDTNKTNSEIKINYNGRADVPVAVTNIYPDNNAMLAKLDNASNPVVVTFDAPILLTENATAELTLVEENSQNKVCNLNLMAIGNALYAYPSATQHLYQDKKYKVTIAAGAVTDASGSGASEEIAINYTGSYIREVSHDNATLFKDDFSSQAQSLINFMRYEGDHLTPVDEMQSVGFDIDNQPWNFSIHESETSTDYCAASHSMYNPAGRSDDWMVIPQLEIPDEFVSLTFKAQSYKNGKNDHLKIYIWECEENINMLTDDIMARLKAEAKLVFDEQLAPGSSEELLSDDWVNFSVDLAQYSGKKIYIAFLNDNNNQSAVFVDDIAVTRAMKFFVALANEESVVNRESIQIHGTLTSNADNETFTTATLTLKDANGNLIDFITPDGLSLSKGEKLQFSFPEPLPLSTGVSNRFSISVELGKYKDEVVSAVKNLTFEPVKRVVLEEMTGITCGNCPLGHIAIEHLRNLYGDQFIPIGIHTYTGDPFANGLATYTSFLGIPGAPMGVVQRNGIVASPMTQHPLTGDYTLSFASSLWTDLVSAEMQIPADAEISAKYNAPKNGGNFEIPVTIKYALNATNLNLNLFVVMLEDGIKSYQENYKASIADPALGEWGQGGAYGQATVYDYIHNDIATACWGSSFNGTPGLLPQSMTAGEDYTVTLSGFTMPETVTNPDNTKVVIMLIDGNTDKVINAVCVKNGNGSGVDNIIENPSDKSPVMWYNLQGMSVDGENLTPGVYIRQQGRDIKKVIIQ